MHVPPDYARKQMLADGLPRWLVDDMLVLAASFREGYGAAVTHTVSDVTKQKPRTFRQFAHDYATRLPGGALRRALALALLAAGAACAAEPPAPAPSPFAPPATIALGASRQPDALAAGDFDGDGRLDLLVASSGSNDVVVLLGDGHGGFRVGRLVPRGSEPDRDLRRPTSIATDTRTWRSPTTTRRS